MGSVIATILFSGRQFVMFARRALALVVGLLLLSGCAQDDPKPKMPDPPSSAPTSTPTESETPKAESAEEFVLRWIAVGDEMQVTGETAEYDSMSSHCQSCQAFVNSVSQVYEGGGSADFAGTTIVDIERTGKTPPTFDIEEDVPETIITQGNGETRILPPGRTTIRVTLFKRRGKWIVTHLGVL